MPEKPKPTKKQRDFASKVIEGASQADAYREAYDAEGSKPTTIRREAHRVASNPTVATMVTEGIEREGRLAARDLGNRRRWILGRLVEEAEGAESDSARVRALELLAKQSGLFENEADRAEKRASASEDALTAELEARLAILLPGVGALDIEPEPEE